MTTIAASLPRVTVSKAWNIGLWVPQLLLAAAFGMAGATKLTAPLSELATMMPWTTAVPGALVRFVGTAEVLGAVGLVLPAATRILPRLTPWAALGLTAIMALAAPFHLSRGEGGMLVPNLVLGGVAAFVAWGRLRKAPVAAR